MEQLHPEKLAERLESLLRADDDAQTEAGQRRKEDAGQLDRRR